MQFSAISDQLSAESKPGSECMESPVPADGYRLTADNGGGVVRVAG